MRSQPWSRLALVLLLPVVTLAAAPAAKPAAHAAPPAMHHTVVAADAAKFGPVPPFLPPGAQLAVLSGDPMKAGDYVVRISAPDGYKVPPHWHPTTENVTVISGTFHIASGDDLDTAKGDALAAGGFVSLPAHMHHYAWMEGATVVQVHGKGPFQITYVHRADDPRKAAAKKP